MSHITKIQSNEKAYRTEIPNFVIDLFESGRISKNSFLFYTTCKRIAGDHGGCWIGNASFTKRLHCSNRDIGKAKEELTKPIPELGNKPLLIIEPGDSTKSEPDHIYIEDIWAENHIYFRDKNKSSKTPPPYQSVPPPVPHGTTPPVPIGTVRKNEEKKKELYKNETSVHKSSIKDLSKEATYERPVSSLSIKKGEGKGLQASPFPAAAKGLTADQLDELQLKWLLAQETTDGKPIPEKQITLWIRKYSYKIIAEAILQAHKTSKNNHIDNFFAYVEQTLKVLDANESTNVMTNKRHAENLVRFHNADLTIKEHYCLLPNTGKEYSFSLPKQTFEEALDYALGFKK